MRIRLVISLLLLLSSFYGKATHIAGGNITYECYADLSYGDWYTIKLTLYYDCSGTASPPFNPNVRVNGCSFSQNIGLTHQSTKEVSNVCLSQLPNTTCNGGSVPGFQEITYTGLLYLANANQCDCFTLTYEACNRNSSNNLNGAGSQCFYIRSRLCNITSQGCHNSVSFFNPFPLPYYCLGQTYSLNLGVFDLDGDSLKFSLVNTLGTNGNNIGYQSGYSPSEPIPGMTIDQNSGQITFTPTQIGLYTVTILIEKYDKDGNLISSVMHDMQIVIQNCPANAVPKESGGGIQLDGSVGVSPILVNPNSMAICRGDEFCFDLYFSDADINDSIFISSNIQAIFPATTIVYDYKGTKNEVNARVCGTIPSTGPSSYHPVFNIRDNFCPSPNTNAFSVNINIIPKTTTSNNVTICLGDSTQIRAYGSEDFVWTVLSGEPIQVGVNMSCDDCPDPYVSPSITTKYLVTDLSNVCVNIDSITVTVAPNFNVEGYDTSYQVCTTESLQLDSIVTSPDNNYSYLWSPSTYLNQNNLAEPIVSAQQTDTVIYAIRVSNPEGCVKRDTVKVFFKNDLQPKISILGSDTTICIDDIVEVEAEVTFGINNLSNYSWSWTPSVDLSAPNSYITDAYPKQTTNYKLNATRAMGACNASDSILITVMTIPTVTSEDTTICLGDSVQFSTTGTGNFIWTVVSGDPIDLGVNMTCDDCADPVVKPSVTTKYLVTDPPNVCANVDSVTITVAPNFTTNSYQAVYEVCMMDSLELDSVVSNPTHEYNYDWQPDTYLNNADVAQPIVKNQSLDTVEYIVTVSNPEGCFKTDTVIVFFTNDVQPQINILGPEPTICIGDTVVGSGILEGEVLSGIGDLSDFDWTWSPAADLSHPNTYVTNAYPLQTTNYKLTAVTNQGLCSATDSIIVNVVDVTIDVENMLNISCFEDDDGSFRVSHEFVQPNLINDFADSIVVSSSSSSQTFDLPAAVVNVGDLSPGEWVITVHAQSGCKFSDTVQLTQPVALSTNFTLEHPSCYEMSVWDGNIEANIQGGVTIPVGEPYLINWYSESTDNPSIGSEEEISELPPGVYILVVEDDNGCKKFDTLTLIRPDEITIDTLVKPTTCPGETSGAIYTSNVQNIVGNAYYSWSPNGETSTSIENLASGNYVLSITDDNGCVVNFDFYVPQPPDIVLEYIYAEDSDCFEGPFGNGVVGASAVGGWTGNFSYYWYDVDNPDTNSTEATWTNRPPGTYTVVATDDSTCSITGTVYVGKYPIVSDLSADPTTGFEPLNVTFNNLSTTGDGLFYVWNLDNGTTFTTNDPDSLIKNIYAGGIYNVTLVVGNPYGCFDTSSVLIEVDDAMHVIVPNVFSPNNDGINDYFILIAKGIKEFHCAIYDRWGKLVYEWDDINTGWDGRRLNGETASDGVYFFTYAVEGNDGNKTSGKGNLTLKR